MDQRKVGMVDTAIIILQGLLLVVMAVAYQNKRVEITNLKDQLVKVQEKPQNYEVKEVPIQDKREMVYVCGQVWDNYHQCFVNRYVAMDRSLVDEKAIIGAIK